MHQIAVGVAEIAVLRPNYRRIAVSFQNQTAGQTITIRDKAGSPGWTLNQYGSIHFDNKTGDDPTTGWYAEASAASTLEIYENVLPMQTRYEKWQVRKRVIRRSGIGSRASGGRGTTGGGAIGGGGGGREARPT